MFETIYALLLRLYPSRFRETYGGEALQLFRDRSRDERGLRRRLRLGLDLLGDLTLSLPAAYFRADFNTGRLLARAEGLPSFSSLSGKSPRPAPLIAGALLSLAALFIVSMLLSQGGSYRFLSMASRQAPGGPSRTGDGAAGGTLTGSGDYDRQKRQSSRSAAAAMDEGTKLDAAERHRVIEAAAANINKYYIDPEIAKDTADALLAHEKKGDYQAVANGRVLADLLSQQMNQVSHDPQLIMIYQAVKEPELPAPPTRAEVMQMRVALEKSNCRFEKVRVLPQNIGYVELDGFPPTDACAEIAKNVMARLNNVNALIFDLRDNRGGMAEMTALLAGYLFQHRTHLNDFYDRGSNSTEQIWTQPAPPGNKLVDKPVYILTSGESFSAAEGFSYDLQMLKRASVVGETTAGRSHMGMPHRLDDHFVIRIPGVKAINPISGTNWEGKGVEPDVKVPAADALATAKTIAEERIARK